MTAIGIDLGTTNSCVAARIEGREEVLENDIGNLVTPSCVTFTERQTLIGEPAKHLLTEEPENTIYSIKRIIGRRFYDPKTQEDIDRWHFKVVECNANERPVIKIDHRNETYNVEEISGLVLDYMRRIACKRLDEDVRDAVVTVPAYFNHMQRTATKTAADLAGLNILGIINEPTAAAIAFGLVKKYKENRNIPVYDLGGGTLDVTVLSIKGSEFDVKASSGNSRLGGDDFTNRLVNHFVEYVKTEMGKDIKQDKRAMAKLLEECEKAKKELSFRFEYTLLVDNIVGHEHLRKTINRAKFVSLVRDLLDKTMDYVKDAIEQSGMKKEDIDFVVPVGGSSKIPYVIDKLNNHFGKGVVKADKNPEQTIARGAAAYAAHLKEESVEQMTEVHLSEVTPMSLGVRVEAEKTSFIIKRNTKLPTKKIESYSNTHDDQECADIQICQGEEEWFEKNEYLGEFELKISRRKKGKVKIDVEFNLDSDGILHVEATETIGQKKGRPESIDINLCGTLEELDILNLKQRIQNMAEKERRYEAFQEAKSDLESALEIIKHCENQDPQVLKRCEEIAEWLQSYTKDDALVIEQKKESIVKFEEERKRYIVALQKAKDDIKLKLEEIRGRNKEDSPVIEKCKEIAKWLQENKEAATSEIVQKKMEIEKFEEIERLRIKMKE